MLGGCGRAGEQATRASAGRQARGYAATGATNGELAKAANTSAPNITRAMALLIAKGWARKSEETGRFHPTPAFTRLTFRVTADLDRLQTRLDDQRRSFTGQ